MILGKATQMTAHSPGSDNKKVPSILLELPPGAQSTITGFSTKDARILKKMMAMGIIPGMTVKVIQKFPSVVFEVGNTVLAVDNGIANCIEIQNSGAIF